ncbi:hypothetical protein KEM48_013598 [Puccinia striiformis f. sp. tritici PST-130]|nr:hypothetical protein KEM48_013598 [Puccinia striiformis f. sp. tritici PST-130]
MSAKAIREYDAKLLVAHFLGRAPQFGTACPARPEFKAPEVKVAQISWDPVSLAPEYFIVEPFAPHPSDTEYYVCINSVREGDMILFTHEGEWISVMSMPRQLRSQSQWMAIYQTELNSRTASSAAVPTHRQDALVDFLVRLYSTYVDLHYTYLEINPLVCMEAADGSPSIAFLDMAAKLDQTADYLCGAKWAIGRETSVAEEAYIQKLDASTGASLKLTVLNAQGRVWTMVAGGGASVVYSDAIAAHGFAHELANYGEYSGAPTKGQTFEYAKTILDLMTRGEPHPEGKVLIIGVKIFVRRGGPNYQEGLKKMRLIGETIGN